MLKVCKRCRQELDSSMFTPSLRTKDALQINCIACAEKHRLSVREHYAKDYELRKKKLQSQRKRYHSDPDFKQTINRTRAMNLSKQYHKDPEFKQTINRRRAKNLFDQYHKDPQYRVHVNISSQIRLSIRDGKKGQSWEKIVGFTLADLMQHLEAQFQEGMTWDNYGNWHIDHRVPKSWFVFDSVDNPKFKECWKLENLKPMWGPENISKGNRFSD